MSQSTEIRYGTYNLYNLKFIFFCIRQVFEKVKLVLTSVKPMLLVKSCQSCGLNSRTQCREQDNTANPERSPGKKKYIQLLTGYTKRLTYRSIRQ